MKQTYKAMQVSRPGQLECVEKNFRFPAREVLIKVEACGICGADSGVVEGLEKSVEYPRVPGHEVVGTICKTSGPLPARLKLVNVSALGDLVVIATPASNAVLDTLTSVRINRLLAAQETGLCRIHAGA